MTSKNNTTPEVPEKDLCQWADFNEDGKVDETDLELLSERFGHSVAGNASGSTWTEGDERYDYNNDGRIDIREYWYFQKAYHNCNSVPEPGTAASNQGEQEDDNKKHSNPSHSSK